jgi:hydrogenase expression/formation protein HypC
MCLGIPGRIEEVDDDMVRMGFVNFGGVRKQVCLAYVPDARVGDYVIVHVGFGISQVAEDEAARTLAVLRAMGDAMEQELGEAL